MYVGFWRRKWQPTPVFLPGGSQEQRSLVGCRLWGCTESDTIEATQHVDFTEENQYPQLLPKKEIDEVWGIERDRGIEREEERNLFHSIG